MALPHAVTALALENFRNYRALLIEPAPVPVILTGRNGAGKTNVLEALSLLAPGRGLRGARLRDMDHLGAERLPFVVAANVTTQGEKTQIGTGRDPETQIERRILNINGKRERSQRQLAAHVAMQWVTPAMDLLFVEGGTPRRKLIDRITYNFAPEHAERVAGYEHAMRERNRVLADRSHTDLYWLSVLEQQMAEHAAAVTLARIETLERLKDRLAESLSGFPAAQLRLDGTLETWLAEGKSALEVETIFAQHLMERRVVDAAAGRATSGPHCSLVHVVHSGNGRAAEMCSTGEQKALLLSIVLAAARARADWCGIPPILLLDEVVAHLDVDKRRALFDLILSAKVQVWMTGTDAADFHGFEAHAWHIKIDGGRVEMCY